MPTLKQQIIDVLARMPGLTDREITSLIEGAREPQQPVNIVCRDLAAKGILKRRRRDDGLIGNYPSGGATRSQSIPTTPMKDQQRPKGDHALAEDEVKRLLSRWLEREGWTVKVAWGKERGLDIDAVRGEERWCIEVKGCGSRPEMRVNYFVGMLGETLQRMQDVNARYSIALPDMRQFRGLWTRLPQLAKERVGITALFVSADSDVAEVS